MVWTVRTTERRTFRRCRKKYEYTYIRGLKPRREDSKLFVGEAVHRGLEAYYLESDPEKAMDNLFDDAVRQMDYDHQPQEVRDQFNEDAALATGMVRHYMKWADENDDFDVLHVELAGRVKLFRYRNSYVHHTFRLDGVIERSDGLWIMEHKTTSSIDTEAEYLELDDQAQTYAWALDQLARGNGKVMHRDGSWHRYYDDRPIQGIMYNFLLKQVPQPVRLNQDGRPSKVQSCAVEDLEDAISAQGIEREPYEEVLAQLARKKWFHRMNVYRTDVELEQHRQRLIAEVGDMRRVRNQPKLRYRNPTKDCTWDCVFKLLCKGEQEGLDMSVYQDEAFIIEGQGSLL